MNQQELTKILRDKINVEDIEKFLKDKGFEEHPKEGLYSALWEKKNEDNHHTLHVSVFTNRKRVPIWEYDENNKPIGKPDWLYFPKPTIVEPIPSKGEVQEIPAESREVSPSEESTPEDCYGFILLLDALGIRTLTKEDSIKFINDKIDFVNKVWSIKSSLGDGSIGEELQKPKFFTFNDTLIFAWKLPEGKQFSDYLSKVINFTLPLIPEGFKNHIQWRGAISCGQYYTQGENTVLGPAITDAAFWYDRTEWVGIIFTPFSGKVVSLCACENSELIKYKELFCEYDVPLKNDRGDVLRKKMWVVPWPQVYLSEQNPRKCFHEDTKEFGIPRGTEEKYFQTREFFIWYAEKFGNPNK